MEEKNKKEVTKKQKTKVKRKRQTSIITIFLWLFLIATMVTITTSNVVNKEALEVEDNNWNITLTMYDKSSTSPNTKVDEITWNATNSSESKQIMLQVNYACTTGKAYKAGEIKITVPGIAKDNFTEYWRDSGYYSLDYSYWLNQNVTVGANSPLKLR